MALQDPASAVRGPVDRLQRLGLIDVREDRGRTHANFYIPHRIEPTLMLPSGLWLNEWIHSLSGAAVLVLLKLLAYQQQSTPSGWEWTRVPRALQPMVRRGSLLVERGQLFARSEPDQTIRRGLIELTQCGVIVELASSRGRFFALKDGNLGVPINGIP
jgi:hypothetical protein